VPVASVDFYDVVRWVHISAVVVAFGPTFAFGIYLAVAQRRDPRALPVIFEATDAITRYLLTIGMVVVLASGIYMTIDRFSFGDVFVNVGLAVVIVLLVLVFAFFIPNDRRAAELAKRDIEAAGEHDVELSAEFGRVSRRSAMVGTFAGLVIILTIYFMTAKPFL
jgi:uncharacterized membrane protein